MWDTGFKEFLSTAAQQKSKLHRTQKLLLQRHMEADTLVRQDNVRRSKEASVTKQRRSGWQGEAEGHGNWQEHKQVHIKVRETVQTNQTDHKDRQTGRKRHLSHDVGQTETGKLAGGGSWRQQCEYVLIQSPQEMFLTSWPPGGSKPRLTKPHTSS